MASAVLFYTARYGGPKTERSNCRFTVQGSDGKPLLVVQLYQDTIPALKGASFGFDLLGGTRIEAAKKLAEMLNEHILDMFVTTDCREVSLALLSTGEPFTWATGHLG